MIAMDWITKLPTSFGYDSILTITDYNCSKAVLLLPCKEAMGTEDLAQVYFSKVFPHYGISNKIISDRDLRLTSKLAKKICQITKIDQNISTAYHSHTSVKNCCTSGSPNMYKCLYMWYHPMRGQSNAYLGPANIPNVIFLV